jgi:hypothetical protein
VRSRVRVLVALVATVAGLGLASCADDDEASPNTPRAADRQGNASLPQQDPALVSEGSPGRLVREYWRYLMSGTLPAAIALYDEQVRARVGVASLAGALNEQVFSLRGSTRPVVVSREPTEAGIWVTTVARSREGSDSRVSFILRRDGAGSWRIVYDTATAFALPSYETGRVQNATDPGASEPGPKALAAAALVAERYRTALFTSDGRLR